MEWLSLTDYASKYRISVSTLRRRIKTGQIEHRLDHGKYLIHDPQGGDVLDVAELRNSYPLAAEAAPLAADAQEKLNQLKNAHTAGRPQEEPIISSATRLLSELKRAYMNVLQEKEEQLIQLKEEVADLKTLVRVLEDDNDRMRRHLSGDRE